MPDVPKIVRERLRVANLAPAEHPDPDVLTAFAESSLSQRERADVLEHLSRCGECREVLALALPASEPIQVVSEKRSTSWVAWPTMRWAFASAGFLALALFGFLQYRHHNESTIIAKKAAGAAVVARNEEVPQVEQEYRKSKEEQTSQSGDMVKRKASANLEIDKHAAAPAPDAGLAKAFSNPTMAGPLAHGPRQIYQQQQSGNVQQVPASVAAFNAPEMKQAVSAGKAADLPLAISKESVQLQAQPAKPGMNSQALDSVVARNQVSSEPGASDTEVSRAKSAPAPAAPPAQSLYNARSLQILAAAPSWTINAGRLQRSFDRGATWQDVNVISSSDAAGSLELAATDRKALKDSVKRNTKDLGNPLVFRAVAANGPDVWAGGAGGALYHSLDAGAHWSRVLPSSSNESLTGDILRLEFRDPQNGTIATSTGEVWSTGDNGQTWQRQ
jgi:Photosynthesis system II assembly factor YCF48